MNYSIFLAMVIGQAPHRLGKVIQWWRQIQGNLDSSPSWMLVFRQHYTGLCRFQPKASLITILKDPRRIATSGVSVFQEIARNERTKKNESARHYRVTQQGNIEKWRILTENHKVQIFNSDTQGNWKYPWFFIHGSDPQYGFYDYASETPNMNKEIQITENLVKKINNMKPKPKFLLITGDLVNSFPSSNYKLYKLEEKTFKSIFGKIDPSIPVLVGCGNHDIGDRPKPEDLDIFQSSWGDDYYSFSYGGIFFLVLNSQYFKEPSSVPDFASKHDKWLDEQLNWVAGNKSFRSVIFQHIPWFLNSTEDVEDYFTINESTRNLMLEKFVNAGVQKIFCGHYHRNAGGKYKKMEIVVTSSICGPLGLDKPGVRLVKVSETSIEHFYYNIEDLPSSVRLDV